MDAGDCDGKLALLNPKEGGTAGFVPAVPPFDFPGPAALLFSGEAGMAQLRVVKKIPISRPWTCRFANN